MGEIVDLNEYRQNKKAEEFLAKFKARLIDAMIERSKVERKPDEEDEQ